MKARPPAELQIPFDRVTYREGQLLASRDLHDDFETAQRLRRMHTRFLHNSWGIALGFTVYGQISDDSIHVGPGYAIDISAREILLSEDLVLPVPQTTSATDFILVVSYTPDGVYRNLPDIAVLCAGTDIDPRTERPVFAWRKPDTLNLGPDVPLAHIRVNNGALMLLPDLSVRRNARRQVRPHIATGILDAIGREIADGLTVVTSDAGFASNPEYFVKLDSSIGGLVDVAAQFAANSGFVLSAGPKQFVYRVPELLKFFPAALSLPFVVTWIGVEPATGCEPVPNLFQYFTYAGIAVRAAARNFQFKGGAL
jgi:hypothetical protein